MYVISYTPVGEPYMAAEHRADDKALCVKVRPDHFALYDRQGEIYEIQPIEPDSSVMVGFE